MGEWLDIERFSQPALRCYSRPRLTWQLVHSGGGFNMHYGHGDSVDACGCYVEMCYVILQLCIKSAATTEFCVMRHRRTYDVMFMYKGFKRRVDDFLI